MNSLPESQISIIIPCLDGLEYIDDLFQALQKQTYSNFEIIFVNSECINSEKIANKLSSYKELDIKIVSTSPLFPGDARNLGIENASSSLIAFLDIKTIPSDTWLETAYEHKISKNYDIVLGKFICQADTDFQESVKAVTFGNIPSDALPGSLLSKELFYKIGGFLEDCRAGEDEEWLGRIHHSDFSLGTISIPTLSYLGLPIQAADLVKKWFFYSIKSAPINVANSQKGAYFFSVFLLAVYFFLNWNYIFTNDQWDESEYFVPHINKIVWSIFFLIYISFRGIFLPYKRGVNFEYILPYKWLIIIYAGLLIDLSKLPGRILGYFYFLKSKLTN